MSSEKCVQSYMQVSSQSPGAICIHSLWWTLVFICNLFCELWLSINFIPIDFWLTHTFWKLPQVLISDLGKSETPCLLLVNRYLEADCKSQLQGKIEWKNIMTSWNLTWIKLVLSGEQLTIVQSTKWKLPVRGSGKSWLARKTTPMSWSLVWAFETCKS